MTEAAAVKKEAEVLPSSPTPTPAAEPTPPASSSSLTDDEMNSLISEDGEDELEATLEPEPPKPAESEPEATPPAVPPKSEEPVAAAPPTETPPAAPKVEPTPAPTAAEPAAQLPKESTPEEQEAQWKAWRDEAETRLVQNYAISKEEADQLAVSPETVFPKLAARIHMRALSESLESMSRALPQMMRAVSQQMSKEVELENQFLGMFPALKNHKDVAIRFVQGYGRANPGQPVESLMQQAGIAAMVHLKLPLEGVPGFTPPAALATPAATPPFVPAPTGAGGAPPARPKQNDFSKLADEFLEDDSGG